ncbi:hypothetical protein C0039_13145 [Pseudohalioglobus lutimaris]|uniref:Uncharacterized protein n=1 Tax=Pseudohalioglobus lutimaris TaxID=1737061 RepID=A0A2N5X1A9_9GAMM|nr:hypothetical protein C0039_13145 [Pseudohalioglobus lutimaris]
MPNFGLLFRFNRLVKGGLLLTLLLFLAVGLSFVSGSVWLVSITLSALLIKLYPVLLALAVVGCGVFLLIHYLRSVDLQ